jgi:hypothetical protein
MARTPLAAGRLAAGLSLLATALWPAAAWSLDAECVTPPTEPRRLAAVDLEGDGDLDVAVATSDGVLLLRNDGHGSLQLLRGEAVGSEVPAVVQLGQGRSFVDVAPVAREAGLGLQLLALSEDGRVTAFELGSDTEFDEVWSLELGGSPVAFAWADVDGDLDMDVAVAGGEAGVSLHLSNGETLAPQDTQTGLGQVTDVAWARLSDGRLGLAVGTDGVGRIFTTTGAELRELGTTTGVGAERVAWQDRDSDGQPEALFGGVLELLEPSGDTVVSQAPAIDPPMDIGVRVAVMGRHIVTTGPDEPIARVFESGTGAAGEDTWQLVEDVERNARGLDLVVAELTSSVLSVIVAGAVETDADPWIICWARGDEAAPDPPLRWPLPPGQSFPGAVALGDVDVDGRLDAAVFGSSTLVVLRNEDGGYGSDELLRVTGLASPRQLEFADVSRDGYPELLVGFRGTVFPPPGAPADPALMIFENVEGQLDPEPAWRSDVSADLAATATDVDGDGLLDLVVALSDGVASIRRGCEETPICFEEEPSWTSQDALRPTALAWGDLDGDHDLDLALHTNQNDIHIFRNDSTPQDGIKLEATVVLPNPDKGTGLFWVDWNGSGAPDLLSATTQTISLYRNLDGVLEPVWSSTDSMSVGEVQPLDWNGDGGFDLVVMTNGGDVIVYLQDKEGPAFAPSRQALTFLQAAKGYATGDVNGDGRADLLLASKTNDEIVLRRPPTLDHGLPARGPRVRAWIRRPDSAPFAGPIDPRPIVIDLHVFDPDGDPLSTVELDYSIDGGRLWQLAAEVTGDVADVPAPADGAAAELVWDWVNEGVPFDHPDRADHPIDTDRLALRVRAVGAPQQTVAGPLVVTGRTATMTRELRRWPDDDHDDLANRWDDCHEDPGDDSDGDGSCDGVDLCLGDDNDGDTDADGVCDSADCGPLDPLIRPGARELCLDGLDNDCDQATDLDDEDCQPEALGRTGLWCGQVGAARPGGAALVGALVVIVRLRRRRSERR